MNVFNNPNFFARAPLLLLLLLLSRAAAAPPAPVCVWDLDGTLFCGQHAQGAVRTCVARGFQLAINTNRGREIFVQEDLANFIRHLGFNEEVTATNLTQWNTDWKRKHIKSVPLRKVYNMERLMEATGQTDKRCLLLFDDEAPNIEAVTQAGYLAQKVYRKGCGTSKEDVQDAMAQFDAACPAAAKTARPRRLVRAGYYRGGGAGPAFV